MAAESLSHSRAVSRRVDDKDKEVTVPLLMDGHSSAGVGAANDHQSDDSRHKTQIAHIKLKSSPQQRSKDDSQYVRLFGLNLSHLPSSVLFVILFALIMFGFLLIGMVEEGFKFAFPAFNFGWFMTAIELLLFSFFAALERMGKAPDSIDNGRDSGISAPQPAWHKSMASLSYQSMNRIVHRKVELKYHIIVAAAMTASRGLTNISLFLLNYPTQVIFKSLKLISVMIGSRFVLQKQYTMYEYFAAPLMVGAAIAFSLGDQTDTLQFNFWGTVVVSTSLIFDSIHANAQEYTLRLHHDTALELLVYSNFFSAVFAAIVGICVGELVPLLVFFQQTSLTDVLSWFLVRVLCLYIGVSALVVFTKRFGAVAATTVTTVRKIATVLLSYVLWPESKVFAKPHAYGTAMFVVSLLLNGAGIQSKTSIS